MRGFQKVNSSSSSKLIPSRWLVIVDGVSSMAINQLKVEAVAMINNTTLEVHVAIPFPWRGDGPPLITEDCGRFTMGLL